MAAGILATAVELNQSAAFKAVVSAALNDDARTWWRDRPGFAPFDPDDPDNFDLCLPANTIAASLEGL